MEVLGFDDARNFRKRADPLLLADEADQQPDPRCDPDHHRSSERIRLVRRVGPDRRGPARALPQHRRSLTILGIPRSEQAIELLANEIGNIPVVVGCRPGVDSIVTARPETYRLKMSQGVYQLDAVTLSPPVDGVSRPARIDDADDLADIQDRPVYTPPEHRGRGYASQLVAAHSQWLLDNGHRYCFLFTDLANLISNSIYRRIGYRQIAESAQYEFSPKT